VAGPTICPKPVRNEYTMKSVTFFVPAILIFCFWGCQTGTIAAGNKGNNVIECSVGLLTSSTQAIEKPYLIPESLYLENRVGNCDSAIVFMKRVIEPSNTGLNGFRVAGESQKFLAQNKLVDKHFLVPNNQRFYISIACLIGRDIETILDIFAKPKFHTALIEKYKTKEKFVIYMRGYNAFIGFYLIGSNGIVNKARYEYTHRIH